MLSLLPDLIGHRFLRLLSEYDWTFSPLVVDINHDLSSEDEKKIIVSAEISYFV